MSYDDWKFFQSLFRVDLKSIETRLRSTMLEDRLESLIIMSSENDISINYNEVINVFSSYSTVH